MSLLSLLFDLAILEILGLVYTHFSIFFFENYVIEVVLYAHKTDLMPTNFNENAYRH